MKKNLFKTMIALCLTMVMFLSMGASVFALTGSETGAVEFINVENTTISAYKVINFNVDSTGAPAEPAYTWSDEVVAWFGTTEGATYAGYLDTSYGSGINAVSKTFVDLGDDSGDIKNFVGALSKAIKVSGSWPTYAAPKSVSEGAKATFDGLTMGGYLFLITDGVNVYRPVFSRVYPTYNGSNWQLADNKKHEYSAKWSVPAISKEIVDVNDKQVEIGDTVEYKLEVTVPDYPYGALSKVIKVVDTLPTGLTLDTTSVEFYKDAGCNEEITSLFVPDKLVAGEFIYSVSNYDTLNSELPADNKMYVKYSATVNEYAYDNTLKNTAKLIYDNSPYDASDALKEVSASTTIYTYGVKISKKLFDSTGNDVTLTEDNIEGVQFELSEGVDKISFIKVSDGVYRVAKAGEIGSTVLEVSKTSGSLGQLLLKGLDVGTYTLTEIKAPNGYAVPTDTIQVQVYDSDMNGKLDASDVDDAKKTSVGAVANRVDNVNFTDNKELSFDVNNYANEFNLPATGGMGTILFTSVGIFVMGAAVVMMVAVLKRGKAR